MKPNFDDFGVEFGGELGEDTSTEEVINCCEGVVTKRMDRI
jgi:hypothetical protein